MRSGLTIRTGKGGRYSYYCCNARVTAGAGRCECPHIREERLDAKQQNVAVDTGDIFTLRTSGGGGLGPPHQRDRAAVAEDLREGRITEVGVAAVVAEGTVAVDPEGSQR